MPFRIWIAVLLIVAGTGVQATELRTVDAVEPKSPGLLTKCFGWLIPGPCRTYHHISLPSRITVGDTITVTFGSNTKTYRFVVSRIVLQGDRCQIFRQTGKNYQRTDRLDVAHCYLASGRR